MDSWISQCLSIAVPAIGPKNDIQTSHGRREDYSFA
jgi:hypothetical protein